MSSDPISKRSLSSRTVAREAALATLYQIFIGKTSLDKALEDTFTREAYAIPTQQFIRELVNGVMKNINRIDSYITPLLAEGWDFSRLAPIDRDMLRIACFELFYLETIPPKATINEAVNIAKKYGSADSNAFVNGVLGRLYELSPKINWDAKKQHLVEEYEKNNVALEMVTAEPVEESNVEVIEEGSKEYEDLKKVIPWDINQKIRNDKRIT